MQEKFHCAFGVDANYVKYAGIVMTSIVLKNPGHPVAFHLFAKGINDEDVEKLEEMGNLYSNVEICVYEVSKELAEMDEALGNIGIGRLNNTVLIRLMVPLMFPDDVERVLYLDAAINEEYGFIYGFLSSSKDFAKFKGIYWSKKYTNAVFTLHRIGREYRQLYVQHMLEEFRGAENKQELYEACFCQQDWQDLQLLLSDSEAYLQKMVPGKR